MMPHIEKEKFDNYKGALPIVLVSVIIIYLLIEHSQRRAHFPLNRYVDSDTIETEDSGYIIKYRIDSVYPIPFEPEM